MKFFSRGRKTNEVIGVEICPDGIALAQIQHLPTQLPLLKYCEYIPYESDQNPGEVLKSRLTKLGLQKMDCRCVLSSGGYQLLLGESPKVPPEELVDALKWRIKDLINFSINDAVVDAFLLPEDSARGTSRMAYAVVAHRNTVAQLVDTLKAAQVELLSIDIPEFALRNLSQACCDTKRGAAIVKLVQGGGSLQIIRDGYLYLSRQFTINYNAGLLDDIPADALVLELQRSLDYFERQLRQSPPSTIYLCGENVSSDKLTPEIKNSMATQIQLLDLEKGLQLGAGVQEHSVALCLLAIGAALRQDQVEE